MFARLEDVTEDRPVNEGDVLLADHRWFVDGEPLGNGAPQEEMLEVRPERVGDELFKALLGLRPGDETRIPRKFSADHPDQKVAGKEGELHLTVKNIRRKILPDLDDSLAQRLGEYATLEDLKKKVREELEEAGRQRTISEMNEMLIEQLLERHPIEVPETMVELEIQRMIRNTQQRLAVHGLTIEQSGSTPEAMGVRYRGSAEKLVRTGVILESIARQEGIHVEEQDLNDAYKKIANQTGRDLKGVKGLYKDTAAIEAMKETLLQEKTLDFLRDKANIVEKGRAVRKSKR
jgi:trigger factor